MSDDDGDAWTAAAAAWDSGQRRRRATTAQRRPRPPTSASTAAAAAADPGTTGDAGDATVTHAADSDVDDCDAAFAAAAAAWTTTAPATAPHIPRVDAPAAPHPQRGTAVEAARPTATAAASAAAITPARAAAAARPPTTTPMTAASAAAACPARAAEAMRPTSTAAAPPAAVTPARAAAAARPTPTTAAATAAARPACAAEAARPTAMIPTASAGASRRVHAAVAARPPATRGAMTGVKRPRAAAASAEADATASDDATSTTSDSSSSEAEEDVDDAASVLSQYSTDCASCGRHVERHDDGTVCEARQCRRTLCTTCRPAPSPTSPPWWCRVHRPHDGRGAPAAGGGSVSRLVASGAGLSSSVEGAAPPSSADAAGGLSIADLPDVIGGQRSDAAAYGITRALRHVQGWRDDPELLSIMDDLADTIGFGPVTTATKGGSAVRRFREFVEWAPARLTRAAVTHDTIDVTLAAYVNARCGVARRSPWQPPRPQPPGVRGEVSAVIGLLRMADLIPADPKGTLPRTRRTLRKCGCCRKYDASPRAYTFAWELEAAWHWGVDKNDPTAVMVWCLCVTAVVLLLRPKYVRSVTPQELRAEGGVWRLRWQRDDKGRPVHRPPDAPELRWVPESGLPAEHPRLTAAGGTLIRRALSIASVAPPRAEGENPLFCRVEPVRRLDAAVPKGAVAKAWNPPGGGPPVPAYWWPRSPLSPRIIKRHLVRFLTPVVGSARAAKRVLSGCRGGGEMELREAGAPLPVRATIGWWRSRLLAAEGAIVTYEGASIEAMVEWTSRLGAMYLRVMAPGVFSTTPPPTPISRSVRSRQATAKVVRVVNRRMAAAAAHAAAGAAPAAAK